MKKMKALLFTAFIFIAGTSFAQSAQTTPASPPASVSKSNKSAANANGVKTKADGTPDKRYTENQKLKADGTPDKRYNENKNLKKDGTPDKRYKTAKADSVKAGKKKN